MTDVVPAPRPLRDPLRSLGALAWRGFGAAMLLGLLGLVSWPQRIRPVGMLGHAQVRPEPDLRAFAADTPFPVARLVPGRCMHL